MPAKIVQAEAMRLPFTDRAFDLVFGSPPYCDARTYGIGAQRDCQPWVDWMLDVTTEALRVSKGAVVWIAAGVTRDRNYWPACEGLMYEWWKRGGSMYRPCYWNRVGVCGSGGDQWFRADVEYAMCFKRPGALPWSDNVAMGHKPKYAPGGEASYRNKDGNRRDKRGSTGHESSGEGRNADGSFKSRKGKWGGVVRGKGLRMQDGTEKAYVSPSNFDDAEAIANPGNCIRIHVGGGHLGSKIAHENEAPFPEKLAEWFLRSLCPPGGSVLDPFSGSGTTAAVAEQLGRVGYAADIRQSQTALTKRRTAQVQLRMF